MKLLLEQRIETPPKIQNCIFGGVYDLENIYSAMLINLIYCYN